jgi:hypothetical protein
VKTLVVHTGIVYEPVTCPHCLVIMEKAIGIGPNNATLGYPHVMIHAECGAPLFVRSQTEYRLLREDDYQEIPDAPLVKKLVERFNVARISLTPPPPPKGGN